MLIDTLKETLKNVEPTIATITAFWRSSNLEDEFQKLHAQSIDENFWKTPDQAPILKRLEALRDMREEIQALEQAQKDFIEIVTLFEQDERELEKIKDDIAQHARAATKLKLSLLLSGEDDSANCFVTINSGAGGTESQDWAEMLLRMYLRFCEREKFSVAMLDYQTGEGAGIKSATFYVKGKNAYGLLKCEHGVHRLVRISPYDANKRRHTSFAAALITPEAEHAAITIDPKDLRVDTFRAGGAGGQHVNKTESAIRITHIPTGIVVQCQSERSQTQNKETAMKMLKAKLVQKQKDEVAAKMAAVERKAIEWGSQIRSYVLHPYKMVKDHRTDLESPQPELVLDGDIMSFIEAYLIKG